MSLKPGQASLLGSASPGSRSLQAPSPSRAGECSRGRLLLDEDAMQGFRLLRQRSTYLTVSPHFHRVRALCVCAVDLVHVLQVDIPTHPRTHKQEPCHRPRFCRANPPKSAQNGPKFRGANLHKKMPLFWKFRNRGAPWFLGGQNRIPSTVDRFLRRQRRRGSHDPTSI